MNHDELRALTPDEQRTIDLLVDGELDPSARRSLLAALDSTHNGWRRLALAYVEDQTLRQDLGDLIAVPPKAVAAAPPVPRPAVWSRTGGIGLAMAASFLLAVGLGWYLRSAGSAATNGVNGDHADVEPTVSIPLVSHPQRPVDVVELPPLPHSNGLPTIAQDDRAAGGQPPVVAAGQGILLRATNTPSALPANVQQALRRLGLRVESRRHRIPIELPDGRRAVVPVEDVEVRYVGNQPYQ